MRCSQAQMELFLLLLISFRLLFSSFLMGLRQIMIHNLCWFSTTKCFLYFIFEAVSSYPTDVFDKLSCFEEKVKIFFFHFQLPFNFDNIQEVNEADLNVKEDKSTTQAMNNSSVFFNGSSLALSSISSLCSLPWFGLFPLWQLLFLPPVLRRIFYFPFSHIRLFCPVLGFWIVIKRESQKSSFHGD